MATMKTKGWVYKDDSNAETIGELWAGLPPHKTKAAAIWWIREKSNIRQVEITITCKDVKKKEKK